MGILNFRKKEKRTNPQQMFQWIPIRTEQADTKSIFLSGSLSSVQRCLSLYANLLTITPLDILDNEDKEVKDHWFKKLLMRPAAYCSRANFYQRMTESLLLYNNFYAYQKENSEGRLVGLLPFNPEQVFAYPNSSENENEYESVNPINMDRPNAYYYQSSYGDKKRPITRRFTQSEIFHIKRDFRSVDLANGTSVFEQFSQSLNASQNILDLKESIAKSGGQQLLITGVEVESPDQKIKTAEDIENFFLKKKNFLTLPEGVKSEDLSGGRLDSLIMNLQTLSDLDVSRIFSVPVSLISRTDSHSGGSLAGLKEEYRFWLRTSGRAYLSEIQDAFSMLIQPKHKARFAFRSVLGSDLRETAMAASQLVQNGILDAGEAKEFLKGD